MAVEAVKTKAEESLADYFEAAKETLPGGAWARELREAAWEQYADRGLPHRRVEEWKYTDLRRLMREAYPPAPAVAEALTREDLDRALGAAIAGIDSYRLVIVDGRFRPELSDARALDGQSEMLSLADALDAPPEWFKALLGAVNPQAKDPVLPLNTAMMSDGVALRIGDNAAFGKPLHIVHVQAAKDPASLANRNVVSIGDGASVTLLESYVSASAAPAQRNAVTELDMGEGASVDHVKFQNEGRDSVHLANWMTRLGANATYRGFQFSTGAAVARNQIFVAFAGEGGVSHISSAVMGRGKQHNDTTLVIDHAVPGCESREFNKAVLDEEARGIVQCKVNVHRDAQKSDGHQMAHGLLLSEGAEFDSKPELEIFADDVACGHGSTSGDIDEESLFYMRSRGVPEDQARALLIIAFVAEAIEKIENEAVREALLASAGAWLEPRESQDGT